MTTAADTPGEISGTGGGVRFMVASSLSFSLMSLFVKLAGRELPTMELVFARAVVVTALAGAVIGWRGTSLRSSAWRLMVLRGLIGLVALACFYYSVVHLPLAEATVIHFTNPVFTAVIAALFLSERLRPRELLLAGASLAGVVIMIRPMTLLRGGGLDPTAVASSLTAAVLAAGAYVLVRRLRREDPMAIVFYFAAVSVVATLPLAPTFQLPRGGEWWLLAGVGVATFLGQVSLTLGLQRERAGRATAVGYLQIVFASVWGALVFGDLPSLYTVIGAAVIVASTATLARLRRGA